MKRIIFLISISIFSSIDCASQNIETKGVGVAFLKKSITENKLLFDTMTIYETSELNGVNAKMIFNLNDRFDSKVESKALNKNALFEFDYESFGLPILEKKENYLKILYGYDQNEEQLIGYIPIDTINYGYRLWDKFLLKDIPIFFNRDLTLQFFDEIDGKRLSIDIRKREDKKEWSNYIMHPLKIEGKWMKVRLNTPSDYCDEPDSSMSKEVWIEYLDKNCELRVWYYVRGC